MLKVLLVLAGVAAFALALFVYAFGESMCGNTLQSETRAPDGQHRAVFFSASCGATDSGTYGVSVLRAGERLTDDTEFNVFSVTEYPAALKVAWRGAATLEVTYDQPWTEYLARDGRVSDRESEVGAVRVVYRDSVDAIGAENARCCAFGRTPEGRARVQSLRSNNSG